MAQNYDLPTNKSHFQELNPLFDPIFFAFLRFLSVRKRSSLSFHSFSATKNLALQKRMSTAIGAILGGELEVGSAKLFIVYA